MKTKLEILELRATHKSQWNDLIRQYKEFYKSKLEEFEYDIAWNRILENDEVFGVGSFVDGVLVGIAHYLFHSTTWDAKVCYLQDLFVVPCHRGQGIARSLIEYIANAARSEQATKFYWLTRNENQPARLLYDRVARFEGFIRYDYPIDV